VAAELSISVETVRSHVSNILAKLEAPSRTAAAARYHELTAAVR
jgi:DNA-binding NarL/FixJ family response regulator